MSGTPMVLVEAERVWYQQHASGLGPDDKATWKPIGGKFIGKVLPAPDSDTRLRFDRYRAVSAEHDGKGLLALGPPSTLPPGHYRTTWWLAGKPSHAAADDVVVTCAVDVKHKPLGKRDVLGATLMQHSGRPFSVVIDIDFDMTMNEVAFVTFWHGLGDLSFLRTECMRM